MSVWFMLGFIPMCIVGVIFFIYIHLKKGRTLYYNHGFEESLLWYIWFLDKNSEEKGYSYINSITYKPFHLLIEDDLLKASMLMFLASLSIVLSLIVVALVVMILSILGPIIYIPIITMFLTLRKIKKSKQLNN